MSKKNNHPSKLLESTLAYCFDIIDHSTDLPTKKVWPSKRTLLKIAKKYQFYVIFHLLHQQNTGYLKNLTKLFWRTWLSRKKILSSFCLASASYSQYFNYKQFLLPQWLNDQFEYLCKVCYKSKLRTSKALKVNLFLLEFFTRPLP